MIKADLCVIGAGAGGLSVAAGAAQMGAHVVLVERDKMGGDCLYTGCVPSKSLLAAANMVATIKRGKALGINTGSVNIDFAAVQGHIQNVIADIEPHDSEARFTELGVTVLKGAARFINPKQIEVSTDTGRDIVQAKRFVIATGSRPAMPSITGLADIDYLTNEDIFNIKAVPKHLLIIGGGAIGVEMAQAHRRLGASVSIIEAQELLPRFDRDIVDVMRTRFTEEGIQIFEKARIEHVKATGKNTGKNIVIAFTQNNKTQKVTGSHILIATGRTPEVEGLHLAAANIAYDARGIQVDARLRSNVKHIFAIGDVAVAPSGQHQLTHMAGYQAGIVLRNALFGLPAKASPTIVPQIIYTQPEIAQIGMMEDEARRQHKHIRILQEPFADNDRARTEQATEGVLKVITTKRGRILGVALAGDHAGDVLAMWILAMEQKLPIGALAQSLLPYPTRAEISKRVAGHYYTPSLFSPTTRRLVRFLNLFR